ncbi:MAG TPA: peptidylprolyl isomerase [Candidatus Angelobacter sp.]|nr:peptidylprolyl isomerase [Candidatus Angelobacter sp.]
MIRFFLCASLAIASSLGQAQSNSAAPQQQASAVKPAQAAKPSLSPPAAKPGEGQASAADAIPADQTVITVHGLCTDGAQGSASDSCTTTVSKEKFDKLLASVGRPVPQNARRGIGEKYVELLTLGQAAKKAGVENDPKFLEQMQLVRLQVLAQIYSTQLQEKNRNPPQSEIEAYYKENSSKYEQIKLRRVFIPKTSANATNKEEFEKKAEQTASSIRERLAKGEDPDALEKEAYTSLNADGKPLNTDFGTRRKGVLPPQQDQEIFSLPAGGVSKVETESVGFVIYKVETKEQLPIEKVKEEISNTLFREKMQEQMKAINAAVKTDFNDQYFGPANPTLPPGSPGVLPVQPSTSPKSPPSPK